MEEDKLYKLINQSILTHLITYGIEKLEIGEYIALPFNVRFMECGIRYNDPTSCGELIWN